MKLSKLFRLSFNEYMKFFKKHGLYYGVGVAFLITVLVISEAARHPNLPYNVFVVPAIFASIIQFVFVLQASTSLSEEFQLGTSTLLFTGINSRTTILISKFLSVLALGMTFGVIQYVLQLSYQFMTHAPKSLNELGHVLVVYLLYSFFIGMLALFMSICLKSRAGAFFWTLILIEVGGSTLGGVFYQYNLNTKILEYIPFYTSMGFLQQNALHFEPVMGLIWGGVVFLIASIVLLDRQDLS